MSYFQGDSRNFTHNRIFEYRFGVAGGWIDTAMNLSGNQALVGTGYLTENNFGCLGYISFYLSETVKIQSVTRHAHPRSVTSLIQRPSISRRKYLCIRIFIMTLKKAAILGLLFSSTISVPALAIDSVHVECDTCVTDAEFITAARTEAVNNKTIFVNVMNFENYELKKFKTTKDYYTECREEREGQICHKTYKTYTYGISVTNSELNLFTDLADSINDARKYYSQRSIEIPSTVVESGYDLIGSGNIPGRVTNYFNQMPLRNSILEKAIVVAGSASKIISTSIKFEAPALVFSFADGVKAYAIIDFVDMDDQTHFKFIKIIHGEIVMDLTKPNPFKTRYDFSGLSEASWAALYEALNAYGLTVRGSSSRIVPRGTVTIVVCSGGASNPCKNPE